jgi:hypothetical protein
LWLKATTEREKEGGPVAGKLGEEGWFSANFRLIVLLLKGIKSTPIYRGSKRVILSTHGKIFNP